MQYKAIYYDEIERGFSILERYEQKFTKAAEYEAKNDFIMWVATLQNIEKLYNHNLNEISSFPDLAKVIKAKLINYYMSMKTNLETRIVNFIFLKDAVAQNSILKRIIKEVKEENRAKDELKNDPDNPDYGKPRL